MLPRHAEGGGDAFAGDVVMRRPDAAGGEDLIIGGAQFVHGADDARRDIRDHPDLLQRDAQRRQPLGDELHVDVLRAAGQNFVADDQDGGGRDCS